MQNSQRALLPPPPRRLGLPLKRSDVDVDEMRFTRAVRVSPFRGRTPERRSPDLRSAERRNLETRGMERRTAEPRSMWRRGGGQSNGKLGEMRGRDNASFDMSSPPRTQRRLFGTRLSPGRQDPPPRRQKPLAITYNWHENACFDGPLSADDTSEEESDAEDEREEEVGRPIYECLSGAPAHSARREQPQGAVARPHREPRSPERSLGASSPPRHRFHSPSPVRGSRARYHFYAEIDELAREGAPRAPQPPQEEDVPPPLPPRCPRNAPPKSPPRPTAPHPRLALAVVPLLQPAPAGTHAVAPRDCPQRSPPRWSPSAQAPSTGERQPLVCSQHPHSHHAIEAARSPQIHVSKQGAQPSPPPRPAQSPPYSRPPKSPQPVRSLQSPQSPQPPPSPRTPQSAVQPYHSPDRRAVTYFLPDKVVAGQTLGTTAVVPPLPAKTTVRTKPIGHNITDKFQNGRGHAEWSEEFHGHMEPVTSDAVLSAHGILLTVAGTLIILTGMYILMKDARRYYLDFGLLSGVVALGLALLTYRVRSWDSPPNRNFLSGMTLSCVLALLEALLMAVMAGLQPPPGHAMGDFLGGGVCGVAVMASILALAAIISSCCGSRPPTDNRVASDVHISMVSLPQAAFALHRQGFSL